MKIGDYVRTKYGISKIISNPEEHAFNIDIFKKDRIILRCIRKKDVIKSSPNIIDLIEVGDYVNGYKVIDFDHSCVGTRIRIWVDTNDNKDFILKYEVLSIVTREQFEAMQYRVGE